MTSEKTLDQARKFAAMFNSRRAIGSPLRFIKVVVQGPTTGYCVCDLGFATSNGLTIIR